MDLRRAASRLAFVLTFVVAVLFVRSAAADDPIPSITIDPNGPNRAIPTGNPFYIEGPATTAARVVVVFVRARWKP